MWQNNNKVKSNLKVKKEQAEISAEGKTVARA